MEHFNSPAPPVRKIFFGSYASDATSDMVNEKRFEKRVDGKLKKRLTL